MKENATVVQIHHQLHEIEAAALKTLLDEKIDVQQLDRLDKKKDELRNFLLQHQQVPA